MKNTIIVLLIIISTKLFCQPEVTIWNFTTQSKTLHVKIYPASMIMNGHEIILNSRIFTYDLRTKYLHDETNYKFHYLNGVSYTGPNWTKNTFFDILPTSRLQIDHEGGPSGHGGCDLAFGFGKYMIEFWWNTPYNRTPDEYCTIEFDHASEPAPPGFENDISIRYHDNNDSPRIMFQWNSCTIWTNVGDVNHKIEAWNQCTNPLITRAKTFGDFRYGNYNGNTFYNILPLDFRIDCDVIPLPLAYRDQNHFTEQYDILTNDLGVLTQNLIIEKNVTTPVEVWNFEFPSAPPIQINDGVFLKLDKGTDNSNTPRTFTFKKYDEFNLGTNLYV